jgi:CheY-like chemotaxis protein
MYMKSGLNVLVAEDNPVNALLTLRMLEKLGHRVHHVENGKAAVEAVRAAIRKRACPIDIILMDLHMPVLDGVDAISAVRRFEDETELSPVPILALTADVLPETHVERAQCRRRRHPHQAARARRIHRADRPAEPKGRLRPLDPVIHLSQ